jgi:hypothetical protein
MLTGDGLLDFGLLTRLVGALMYCRATDKDWPLIDAGLVRLVVLHGRMLYILGGQGGLDRAILHISRQVGPNAAAAAMDIFASMGCDRTS